ncbi:LOW QUALITY PROTEIN: hypothetical protein M8C21_007176, partial [Ambrosia artemisiifolia]
GSVVVVEWWIAGSDGGGVTVKNPEASSGGSLDSQSKQEFWLVSRSWNLVISMPAGAELDTPYALKHTEEVVLDQDLEIEGHLPTEIYASDKSTIETMTSLVEPKLSAKYFLDTLSNGCITGIRFLIQNSFKGPWTHEEDEKVVGTGEKIWLQKWSLMAKYRPGHIEE